MFQVLPDSLLRPHHLSRKERRQLREKAANDLQSHRYFLGLSYKLQKKITSSANTALAWQALLGAETDCSELEGARKRLLGKATVALGPSPLLRFPRKNSPLAPELLLFAAAAETGELYRSESARNHLQKISPLEPADTFLVPGSSWDAIFASKKLLGLWDPRSELIFLRKETESRDHILLHEMIHSLQKAGQPHKARYGKEKSALLEGITEEATVLLDGQESLFYRDERALARRLLRRAERSIDDLVFLSDEQMFAFFCQDLGCTEKDLARWIRQQNFVEPLEDLA